jgi:hypothetical protein
MPVHRAPESHSSFIVFAKTIPLAPRGAFSMSTIPFSEAYCRRHHLSLDRFEHAVLARALYPHARILAPLIRFMKPDHFAADLDLVRGTGQLRRLRDFGVEATDFAHHPAPANIGSLRHVLRLRASTQRLRRLVQETLHESTNRPAPVGGTEAPFSPSDTRRLTDIPRHP